MFVLLVEKLHECSLMVSGELTRPLLSWEAKEEKRRQRSMLD